MARDYYEVLGVARNADVAEIKRAYRRLARDSHPDANPGDKQAEERFKSISAAYAVLSDPQRRLHYDRFGESSQRVGAAGDPFGGFGDLFETFFGSGFGTGSRRRGPIPGEDLETVIELEFEEAVFGCEQEITVHTAVACVECEATGTADRGGTQSCETCQGAGEVQRVRQSLLGQVVTRTACPTCGGRGETIVDPCGACSGEGRVIEEQTFTVHVRAGVDEGTTLRLMGRGAVGPRGGPTGDLYVHVNVHPHDFFVRRDFDLLHRMELPVTQAALGAAIDYKTLDGDEVLNIPRGTVTGDVFRMRGSGVPHVEGRGRGDLLIEVVVATPTDLDKGAEDFLRRLAAARGEEVAPVGEGIMSKIRSALS
ncbi:MAG: molecular chaperone DnaJ [Acidimicrobiales bacterium]|nr:molecular chaperone DnaJ [Acidimicrobiaceae bacterium]MDP6077871.1 molecular chaperone DnaJ [Acidimicrobiales bacterium]HCV35986.1 molecular chaperone DnaJ [Acidimicrobiaceae bacterium]HJO79664.1 molecular chaperone DnaJ [Acidimicrobiales bacterium]